MVQITDFGVSDVFRMCWEKKTHLSKGLCGSEPYIAPELFEQKGQPLYCLCNPIIADMAQSTTRA